MLSIFAYNNAAAQKSFTINGTGPFSCSLSGLPAQVTVQAAAGQNASKILVASGAAPGDYTGTLTCTNCSGANTATLTISLHVEAAVNCAPQTPPGSVMQQVVYNQTPVVVPAEFLGIHMQTYNSSAGQSVPAPTYAHDFIRTHDAEVSGSGAPGMWRNIETSPGVYDFSKMIAWSNANPTKKILLTVFGTPEFYVKYTDGSAAALNAAGGNGDYLYPGSGNFNSPPSDMSKVANFVAAWLANATLGPRTFAVELWNEPNLPLDGSPRWNAAWGVYASQQGWYNQQQSFYNGTAQDMVDMAAAIKPVLNGKPLWVLGCVDSDTGQALENSFKKMLNASKNGQTLLQLSDAVSVHWYDYQHENFSGFVATMTNYRNALDGMQAGVGATKPLVNTETGDFAGTMSATQLGRLILISAAMKLKALTLYNHTFSGNGGHHMGDPVENPISGPVTTPYNSSEMIQIARNAVSGKTICEAALLTDGRVWVHTSDGNTIAV